MEESSIEKTNLGIDNVKEGLLPFYCDVTTTAILLASSNDDNSLVSVKTGPENSEKYEVGRQKIKVSKNPDDINQEISRIMLIDQLLNGIPIEDVVIPPPIQEDSFLTCYYGEDWFITIDENGNEIEKFVMRRGEKNMKESNKEIASIESLLLPTKNNNIISQKGAKK